MLYKPSRRRGATLVEGALIYPILFLFLLTIIVLGIGVFRYQQVAHMVREGSRWASVHGTQYAKEQITTPATPEDVYVAAILPHAAGMQTSGLTYKVEWRLNSDGTPAKSPTWLFTDPITGRTKTVHNTVTVTVTYTWDMWIFGTIPVRSRSVNTISY